MNTKRKRDEDDSSSKIVVADESDNESDMALVDDDEVIQTIEDAFGSVHNLLQYCSGSGTYLLMGPTDSGKTCTIGSLYKEAQIWSRDRIIDLPPVIASSFVVISDTDDLTSDLKWCANKRVRYPLTAHAIDMVVNVRKREMKRGAAKENEKATGSQQPITPKDWANRHPLFIILDDYYGIIDTSKPNNPVNKLSTKARNYGIYLFTLAQGFNQCSPVIKQNARAIVAYRLNAENHKEILKKQYGISDKNTLDKVVRHNSQLYKPVVYVRTWELSKKEFGSITPRPLILPEFTPLTEESVAGDIKVKSEPVTNIGYKRTREEYEDLGQLNTMATPRYGAVHFES